VPINASEVLILAGEFVGEISVHECQNTRRTIEFFCEKKDAFYLRQSDSLERKWELVSTFRVGP